ncbi:hypothetical protein [Cytobacillus gottheilii]|nr:hypothetical protein [Cytobacillus gottheilii]
MNILKGLFGKKETACCMVKIEEVKNDSKPASNKKNDPVKERKDVK